MTYNPNHQFCSLISVSTTFFPSTGFLFLFSIEIQLIYGLPWWLSGKESTCQCRRHKLDPGVRKIPWRRKWQPTVQYYCLGNPPGGLSSMESQRVGYNLATEKKKSLIVFKTVLCQFLLYSKVIQLYAHIYTHIFFLISLPLRFITGFWV